ncbi:PREDICTED: protein FAM98A-like [Priapulus caudatus]|uniref:Protein FAM98A-like n=1 Tax=Priapulus caudatus TaxID=37621 RepID=A0ABM1F0K5_PRICU|nr:PREDICTED: protein FAM98A-like [Priapulus caudatus]
MECDILDNLDHLGYHEEITDDVLVKWLNASPASPEFSRLVSWLSLELKALCKLEEHVNPVTEDLLETHWNLLYTHLCAHKECFGENTLNAA